MTEKGRKTLRIVFRAFVVAHVVLAVVALFLVDYRISIWMLITSYWMWQYQMVVDENAKLHKDKWGMADLVFAQHEYMKRKIQEAREAARATNENEVKETKEKTDEEIRQGQ